jgi:hypothetical protein
MWVEVQNIGKSDAKDAVFSIIPGYPFTSNDSLTREYGVVSGLFSAYNFKQSGEATIQANQIVMKFRMKADDNAPAGDSMIKFSSNPNKGNPDTEYSFSLPISIEKTKTEFNVKLHDISPKETSLTVLNTGENDAKAVTIDVKDYSQINTLEGMGPSSLGDIAVGENTVTHMKMMPKSASPITVVISYTDKSGVRTNIEKEVAVDESKLSSVCAPASENSYMKWMFAIGGFIIGLFLMVFISVAKSRKHSHDSHKHSEHHEKRQ